MKKKIISLILSAAMVATATVVPVSAADVKDFADVAADSWYYDSVDFVAERDYMNGTSATTFSPDNNMTRAMFVTVMARVAGAQTDNNAVTEFTDVPSGQWYTGAVQWGVEKGLVQGHGDGTFGTNDPITRQDTAVLAQRFLKWYSEATGLTPETGAKVDSFTDASSISDYAKDAVEYCRQIGLLTGYEDGSFQPLKSITRAEAATILKRMTFLAEGVLTVTYTDENGKTVMMEVKEGDTFTVDPNGGKITYDGKTYDAEFTITVGTASLTLPAPTRSGYTFKGWKVTEAADGTPAFTAQWASSGGGGGGGSSVVAAETYTYQVSMEAGKGDRVLILESGSHDVAYNEQGEPIYQSQVDDVKLVELAKEMVTPGQISKVINVLTDDTPFFTADGVAEEVTVKTISASQVISEDVRGQIAVDIADQFSDPSINTEFVDTVLKVLDEGVANREEFITALGEIDPNLNTDAALEVVDQISLKLTTMEQEEFNERLDKAVGGKAEADKLLKAIGLSRAELLTKANSYGADLQNICNPDYVGGFALLSNSDEGTSAGGIEIKLNFARTLINQYEEGAAEKAIRKALEEAGVADETITKILENNAVENFIAACDPDPFFDQNDTDENGKTIFKLWKNSDKYKDFDTDRYKGYIDNIIAAADAARKSLCEADLLTDANIEKLIEKSVNKAKDYIDNPNQEETLDKILNNKEALADLLVDTDPTLLDLLEIIGDKQTKFGPETVEIELTEGRIESIINKIFDVADVDGSNLEDSSLMDDLKEKLVGTYSLEVEISVEKK